MRNSLNILFCLYMFDGLSLEGEEWRMVQGYNYYYISSCGRLLSVFTGSPLFIKTFIDHKGYPRCFLSKNGKSKGFRIHRLVAQAFIKNKLKKPQVNHINEIKTDNRVENLEWCTPRENFWHSEKKNNKFLSHQGNRKISIQIEKCIQEELHNGELNMVEISKKYECSYYTVTNIKYKK